MRRREFIAGTAATAVLGLAGPAHAQADIRSASHWGVYLAGPVKDSPQKKTHPRAPLPAPKSLGRCMVLIPASVSYQFPPSSRS